MPVVEYVHDDVCCRISIKTGRTITVDEVLSVVNRQAAEGAWSYEVLWDSRETESIPTLDELRRTIRHVGMLTTRHGPRGPVAIVTTQVGLRRMTEIYAEFGELTALDVRAFSTIEEAETWLATQEGREHAPHSH
jgi:hypothetical protein